MKKMKITTIIKYVFVVLILTGAGNLSAQQPVQKPIEEMTREDVLDLSYEQLLEMPLDDLMMLAEIVGVSMDELLELALNKSVTTASKRKETVFESPLSTTVLTSKEIEMAGATSIEEALRLVPGMIVREKTNGIYDVHMRGLDNVPPDNFSHFSENMISLVMIDGVPVYNNVAGGTFWETLPVGLSQIERIDVVRGPSTALYGPNAVSGVINIVTKNDSEKNFNIDGTARGGNYATLIGDIHGFYKFSDKIKLSVTGKYDVRNRFDDVQYQYFTGTYEPFEDSILNITGIDYFGGPAQQSIPLDRAREVYASNASLFLQPMDELSVNLNGGYQSSTVQTVFFENIATPFSARSSRTTFGNMHLNFKGLSGYVSYQGGTQNLSEGMIRPVIKYDMQNITSNLEYDFDFGKLSVRPGINYQYAAYNDAPYEIESREKHGDPNINGLFHGEKYTALIGGSVRGDYSPLDNLRLIAALRLDKYDFVEDPYMSYQFVGSFKINEDNIIRALYSKANRGAFLGDLHANFKNPILINEPVGVIPEADYNMFKAYLNIDPNTAPLVPLLPEQVVVFSTFNQYYIGTTNSNRNLDLMSMQQAEIGWRGKLTSNIQVDVEAFHSVSDDFDALVSYAYSDTSYYSLTDLTGIAGMENQMTPFPSHLQFEDSLFYENLSLRARQFGISATLNISVNDKMLVKAFGTYQQTNLEKHKLLTGDLVDREHENTPSFFGGLSAMYVPTSKLDLFLGSYIYTSQVYNRYWRALSSAPEAVEEAMGNAEDKIDAKVILNARVAYEVFSGSKIFVEGKNLLFNDSREFGFADRPGTLIMGGIQVDF